MYIAKCLRKWLTVVFFMDRRQGRRNDGLSLQLKRCLLLKIKVRQALASHHGYSTRVSWCLLGDTLVNSDAFLTQTDDFTLPFDFSVALHLQACLSSAVPAAGTHSLTPEMLFSGSQMFLASTEQVFGQ